MGLRRNLGVKHSNAALIAFIDDDAIASPDWLSNIYFLFSKYPDLACAGGPHITPKNEKKGRTMHLAEGTFAEILMGGKVIEGKPAVGKIAGCNVVYRKNVFEKVGLLNEKYRSGEDWDLHIRLCNNGNRIRFEPSVWVWHHRQGLKHAFLNSSKMFRFFMSWSTIKYARYESFFASYYLTNAVFVLLVILAFTSLQLFAAVFLVVFLGYFFFNFMQLQQKRSIVYFPLSLVFTLARIGGFYYGFYKYVVLRLR